MPIACVGVGLALQRQFAEAQHRLAVEAAVRPEASLRGHAMAVVVVFGGLFSLQGAFFGSPEGLIFLPFAVYFFIWVKRRQRVLKDVINAVDARFKEPQTFASAAVTRSLDGTIPFNSGL